MNFDKLLSSSAPVDRTAARVVGKGFHHEVKVKAGDTQTWDAPPLSAPRPAAAADYTGVRRGFMTAFRYHEAGKNGSKWLVRCDCGNYEVRSIKKWAERQDLPDGCTRCRRVHYVKTGLSALEQPA